MAKVAFLGLGAMGFLMAAHLRVRGGHAVTVYNRTIAKSERWTAEFGGVVAKTPRQAATDQDFVFSCVGTDADLRAITLGEDGAFAGMKPGAIFADHTTASADVAREIHAIAKIANLHALDAPVSGGQFGAEHGILTVMCGGDADAYSSAKPVMTAFARTITLLGGAGAGQLAKMANQICIAGIVQSLAEAIHFGRCAGLNVNNLIEAISKGSAQSWQMDIRCRNYLGDTPEFALPGDFLMPKDLGICLAEAQRNGAHLPVALTVHKICSEMVNTGGTPNLLMQLQI